MVSRLQKGRSLGKWFPVVWHFAQGSPAPPGDSSCMSDIISSVLNVPAGLYQVVPGSMGNDLDTETEWQSRKKSQAGQWYFLNQTIGWPCEHVRRASLFVCLFVFYHSGRCWTGLWWSCWASSCYEEQQLRTAWLRENTDIRFWSWSHFSKMART